jgi:hypothetical protein
MLTGRKAFEGQSQASLIAAILEREPKNNIELLGMVDGHAGVARSDHGAAVPLDRRTNGAKSPGVSFTGLEILASGALGENGAASCAKAATWVDHRQNGGQDRDCANDD